MEIISGKVTLHGPLQINKHILTGQKPNKGTTAVVRPEIDQAFMHISSAGASVSSFSEPGSLEG